MNRYLAIACMCFCFACSTSIDPIGLTDVGLDFGGEAVDGDLGEVPDVQPEADIEITFVGKDTGSIDGFVDEECLPGDGCFLDPCVDNSECLSGWCVEHLGEGVCTQACQEDCPDGWTCSQVGVGPDILFICVSDYAHLCRPCTESDDCQGTGGTEDVCVDYGSGMGFCGGQCDPIAEEPECPWGFSCLTTSTVDGISTSQCVAETGVCPCSEKAVTLGLWTGCTIGNEWGECSGKRVCLETGLAECDALVPAEEICNGVDDNCDGVVDEASCDDGNACTMDSCEGDSGCLFEPLTGANCDDGDACTITDHCDDGTCVGSLIACDDNNPCTDDSCDGLSGCLFETNHGGCDDGNACTIGDTCAGGECAGTPVECECETDSDCGQFEDGNICNGTLICEQKGVQFQCVIDPESVVECAPPTGINASCLKSQCKSQNGMCETVAANGGYACEDGNQCTYGETCQEGSCQGASPLNCNDGDVCTTDACQPDEGCVHEYNAAPCDDGNLCTHNDYCEEGECLPGEPFACDDANPCTDDLCSPLKGCLHTNNIEPCDDQDPCTLQDSCSGGSCVGTEPKDCNDNNPCTDDLCIPLAGCSHQVNNNACDDGDKCTQGDSCVMGSCVPGETQPCNDGNPCTDDLCDANLGCYHNANDAPCDDFNTCTTNDHCSNSKCLGSGTIDCDDKNPCTKDICEPGGGCQHEGIDVACTDGNPCTLNDHCVEGTCQPGLEFDCDDGNPCTVDLCNDQGACEHNPAEGECDDGNPCTAGDKCVAGECKPESMSDCDDQNVCTTDSCHPVDGCLHALNTAWCDDGDPCTAGDKCALGLCEAGESVDCEDDNPCTADSCLDGKCIHTPSDGDCDDSNPCTENDLCAAGVCIGTTLTDCDDVNVCTKDYCLPLGGCQHDPVESSCNDADACTTDDACVNGLCVGGAAPNCDDGNICTTDSCDVIVGCLNANNDGVDCDDSSACTETDLCSGGVCVGSNPPDCDDQNVCTTDSCDVDQGCLHVNDDGKSCDDGDPATSGDKCEAGVCKGSTSGICGDKLSKDPQQVKAGWTLCYVPQNPPGNIAGTPCHNLFNSSGKTYGCWHGHSTYPHQNNNGMVEHACKSGVQNSTTYNAWGGTDHILTVCIQN
jgi:hypothetical protein